MTVGRSWKNLPAADVSSQLSTFQVSRFTRQG